MDLPASKSRSSLLDHGGVAKIIESRYQPWHVSNLGRLDLLKQALDVLLPHKVHVPEHDGNARVTTPRRAAQVGCRLTCLVTRFHKGAGLASVGSFLSMRCSSLASSLGL